MKARAVGPTGRTNAGHALANLLNRPIFKIDRMACLAAAEQINRYHASVERMPWAYLPRSNQLTFKMAVVAICHQINWDFLHDRLAQHLLSDDLAAMVQRLASVRSLDLAEWLAGYDKPERIQAIERSALLRTIGRELLAHFSGDPSTLVEAAAGKISGPTGFVAQLDRFEPYRLDPLRKKSYVLVQDLLRQRIVDFTDEGSLQPAIDYHIMRLYLRSGRVVPLYDVVAETLKGMPRPRPRLVRLLRETVAEALLLTASYAKLSMSAVNYIEWELGRSVCDREQPGCLNSARTTGLDPDVGVLFTGLCPYVNFCEAHRDPEWRKLQEPQFATSFY